MNNTPQTQPNPVFPIIVLLAVVGVMVFAFTPEPAPRAPTVTPSPTIEEVAAAQPTTFATPADHLMLMTLGLEEVPLSNVQKGARLFNVTCTACHGANATGIAGLGKPLVNSDFVNKLNDDELVAFIIVGRQTNDPLNSTGQLMPARGNNPSLTDDDLHALVDYIRSLNGAKIVNDLEGMPTPTPIVLREFKPLDLSGLSAPTAASTSESGTPAVEATPTTTSTPITLSSGTSSNAPTPTTTSTPITLSSGTSSDAPTPTTTSTPIMVPLNTPVGEVPTSADSSAGQADYIIACESCHGADGHGVALVADSDLSGTQMDDAAMFTLLTQLGMPDQQTMFVHPVRGGYLNLSDEQIRAIIGYIRELNSR